MSDIDFATDPEVVIRVCRISVLLSLLTEEDFQKRFGKEGFLS